MAFVPHESMRCVKFEPLVMRADSLQLLSDLLAALERNVRVLPAPHEKRLALHVPQSGKGIIIAARPKRPAVNVGSIEARCRLHAHIECGAQRQMPTKAFAYCAKAARARRVRCKVVEPELGIPIEGGYGFGYLESVPPAGPFGGIGKATAGRLELMVHFRHATRKP